MNSNTPSSGFLATWSSQTLLIHTMFCFSGLHPSKASGLFEKRADRFFIFASTVFSPVWATQWGPTKCLLTRGMICLIRRPSWEALSGMSSYTQNDQPFLCSLRLHPKVGKLPFDPRQPSSSPPHPVFPARPQPSCCVQSSSPGKILSGGDFILKASNWKRFSGNLSTQQLPLQKPSC